MDLLGGGLDHLVQTDASVGELVRRELQITGLVEHHDRQYPDPSGLNVGYRVEGLVLEWPWILYV